MTVRMSLERLKTMADAVRIAQDCVELVIRDVDPSDFLQLFPAATWVQTVCFLDGLFGPRQVGDTMTISLDGVIARLYAVRRDPTDEERARHDEGRCVCPRQKETTIHAS